MSTNVPRIVECVPNISNGTHPEVYKSVAAVVEKFPGVKLLDIDPGAATNRTVITFAGAPEVIVDAAFELIKTAKALIDMRTHKGEHPRMGAVDVCPFVPVSGVTLEECALLARKLAKRVGEELSVWAYLYEAAASKAEWRNLANIRKGEYESLQSRQGNPEWRPDFGPADAFDPKFGAIAIGARKFLVAYNINVNSANKKWANDIAMNIRESGRSKRVSYPDGDIVRNPDGTPVNIPGRFSNCKATAWVIPEYNRAQVTMNLTDTDVTPLHEVFDVVNEQARERGVRVTGSEIVGLVPLNVMLNAGKHYLQKQGLSTAVSEREIIDSAIMSLGLSDVSPFDPQKKIVEYHFRAGSGKLVHNSIEKFCDILASDAPAPGGGSIAALCGSLAAALATMVSNLTHGKAPYRQHWSRMEEIGVIGQSLKSWFMVAIDSDTDAFNLVMAASKLPQANDEQKSIRKRAIEEANQAATLVPLDVMEKTLEVLPLLEEAAHHGNPNCISDAGVGAYCLLAAAEGAALNVVTNLKNVTEQKFIVHSQQRVERVLTTVRKKVKEITELVDQKLRK
ncbi:MAG: glutamate formimidoyltransferase [Oligoflexia bacterium]|nr:glutamate formimidoyltransferase [Oligoflexia bacterium]